MKHFLTMLQTTSCQYTKYYLAAALAAVTMLFAPLALGAVQGWAVGVISLLVLTASAACLLEPGERFSCSSALDKHLAALLVLTACSLLFSKHYYASSAAAAQLLACLLFYYIILHVSKKRSGLIFLLYWIIGIATLLCLIGIARRNGLNPVPWLETLGLPPSNPHSGLTATFVNHNHAAGWLEMSMPLLLCLICFGWRREWLPALLLLLLMQGACLFLTFSRGGWAGGTASVIFVSIWFAVEHGSRRVRIILLFTLTAFLAAALLLASPLAVQRLHQADLSLSDRMQIWRSTISMIWAHWLTGAGPGTYSLAFVQFQPPAFGAVRVMRAHNDYLHFTAELGLALPVLLLWMGTALYRHGLRRMKSASSRLERAATLGSLAGITAILVHSISDFNLHVPANALLFTALTAFAARQRSVK
jgi:O-antigen ligase